MRIVERRDSRWDPIVNERGNPGIGESVATGWNETDLLAETTGDSIGGNLVRRGDFRGSRLFLVMEILVPPAAARHWLGWMVVLTVSSALAAEPNPPDHSDDRLNFVVFLVDDLGWGSMGAFGSPFHETPHFDQLCRRGMRFEQAYAACCVCSPSRAAILTGQYPARLHLTDWIPGQHNPDAALQVPDWKMSIDPGLTTFPEALQQHGYKTAFFGKWHLIPVPDPSAWADHTPEKHGFDLNVGGREWGHPKGRGRYFFPFDMPGLEEGQQGDYLTDRLTDEAESFLDSAATEPFLLYMSYYTVHSPVMGKPDMVQHFLSKSSSSNGSPQVRERAAAMAAMHQSMDESVGRIVDKLDRLGLTDKTVIVFTGDNGGDRHELCGQLRGAKGYGFEGGTRVPTCVVWPGMVPSGSVNPCPIIGMDFFATILEIAGIDPPSDQPLDGVSLVSTLTQSLPVPTRALYWHYPHYHRTQPYGAIRNNQWKLIEFFENGQTLLFDLDSDPYEATDLSTVDPRRATAMLSQLRAWRAGVSAQMPTVRDN